MRDLQTLSSTLHSTQQSWSILVYMYMCFGHCCGKDTCKQKCIFLLLFFQGIFFLFEVFFFFFNFFFSGPRVCLERDKHWHTKIKYWCNHQQDSDENRLFTNNQYWKTLGNGNVFAWTLHLRSYSGSRIKTCLPVFSLHIKSCNGANSSERFPYMQTKHHLLILFRTPLQQQKAYLPPWPPDWITHCN